MRQSVHHPIAAQATLRPLTQPRAVSIAVGLLCLALQAHAQNDLPVLVARAEMPSVSVISVTPLPGIGLARNLFPAPVQSATVRDLADSGATDLSEFLNRRLGSVHVNEVQANPFMMDVNYRGYTASPLLGTPQGLSVYVDGVRQNQAFGDVVLWDLIPKSAIAGVTLMPGANPLFGLNTLGGALSIDTKDGRRHAGTAVELSAGQHGRASLGLEHGGANDKGLDWFVAGTTYRDSGWRDDSPSRIGQFFGKVGWRDGATDVKLSLAHADTDLTGNGLQQRELLAADRNSVFTKPDQTQNRATQLNLQLKHALSDQTVLSGNAYWRQTRTRTFNGDLNEEVIGEGPSPTACVDEAAINGEPNEACSGIATRTRTSQRNMGLQGQISMQGYLMGLRNQAVLGSAFDTSRLSFTQGSQFGYLNDDRSLTLVNAFADGTQDSSEAFDARVRLKGRVTTWSLFGSDTLSLNEQWHVTASGRFNDTRLKNTDQLYPYNNATTQGELRGTLDGNHRFSRFNPALGVSFTPNPLVSAYAGYAESSRAPTSVELGCADPEFGCRLPNSMAGDPPLKQVVSHTWEMGVRGLLNGRWNWNLGTFLGDNTDDILFVANNASTGYFKNFGRTRRQGVEAGVQGRDGAWTLGMNLTWMKATYQTREVVGSEYHSGADADNGIVVNPGDRIPQIPSQILKAQVAYDFGSQWRVGLDMQAVSGSPVRGNEDNRHHADGITTFGSGRNPGYAVFNFSGRYQVTKDVTVRLGVSNLFDRHYATAGQLGARAFAANGTYTDAGGIGTTFYSPGAPRTVWATLRWSM